MRTTPAPRESVSHWSSSSLRLTLVEILCAVAAASEVAMARPEREVTAEVREAVPIWSQSSVEIPIATVPAAALVDGQIEPALERLTESIRQALLAHFDTQERAPEPFAVRDLEEAAHLFDQIAVVELGAGRHTLEVVAGDRFNFGRLDRTEEYAVQPIIGCLQCEARLLTFRDGHWEARGPDGAPAASIRCVATHPRTVQVRVTSRSGRVEAEALRRMEATLNEALQRVPDDEPAAPVPPGPARSTVRLVVDLDVTAP